MNERIYWWWEAKKEEGGSGKGKWGRGNIKYPIHMNIYDGGWVVSGGGDDVEKPFGGSNTCTYVMYIQNVEYKGTRERIRKERGKSRDKFRDYVRRGWLGVWPYYRAAVVKLVF